MPTTYVRKDGTIVKYNYYNPIANEDKKRKGRKMHKSTIIKNMITNLSEEDKQKIIDYISSNC